MSFILKNCYKIKLVTKADDEDYIKAIKIYNDETPPEIKTSSNQISAWIDRKKDNLDFEFMVFVAYLDDEVIGFAEIAYFSKNSFVLIDYLTLKKNFRVNAVFFPVLSLIQIFMQNRNSNVNYWITEINNKDDGKNIDRESAFFKKLICVENFGFINTEYYHPYLGEDNFESSFVSKLYLKTNDKITNLSKETVLLIIKSIYYSYYLEWYRPFMTTDGVNNYKLNLDVNFEKIKSNMLDQINISIECRDCLLPETINSQSTSGTVPAKKTKPKLLYYLIVGMIILICPLLITILYNQVLSTFGLGVNTTSLASGIGTMLSALIAAATVYFVNTKKNVG